LFNSTYIGGLFWTFVFQGRSDGKKIGLNVRNPEAIWSKMHIRK